MTAASPLSAVPLATDAYARHVVARLLDFFAADSPWPRRLREVTNVLALQEAAETGDWIRMRVLSPAAVSWYLRMLERQLGPLARVDPSAVSALADELQARWGLNSPGGPQHGREC